MRFRKRFATTLRRLMVTSAIVSLPAAALPAPAHAIEDPPQESVHTVWDYNKEINRFIVKFNNLTGQNSETNQMLLNEIASKYGSEAKKVRDGQDGAWIVELEPAISAANARSFRADLESKAQINWADPDYFMVPFMRPNDPIYHWQWQFNNPDSWYRQTGRSIKAESAWDLGYLGDGVNVAVVDTGITDHPDLDAKVKSGFDMINDDFVARDGESSRYSQRDANAHDPGDYVPAGYCSAGSPAKDSSWHGTHVAGLVAADTNNGIGGAGTAPEADIVPVRVLGACGGYASDIADGLLWASGGRVADAPENRNPARVINLSLGGPGKCSNYYQNAVNKARRNGSVLVVAAGNDNVDASEIQPASCDGVITVGATGPVGEKSSYSNWGDVLDVASPGGNSYYWNDRAAGILSTINLSTTTPGEADYGYLNGTSMATPIVSGVVAMMLDANPNLSPDRVEEILKQTAQPFGDNPARRENIGRGIIDAREAVCQAVRDRGGKDCDKNRAGAVVTSSPQAPNRSTAPSTRQVAPTSSKPVAPERPSTPKSTTSQVPAPAPRTTTTPTPAPAPRTTPRYVPRQPVNNYPPIRYCKLRSGWGPYARCLEWSY